MATDSQHCRSVPIPDLTLAVQFVHRAGNSRAGQWGRRFSRSETTEHSRVSADRAPRTHERAGAFPPKSPVSRVIETSAIIHLPVSRMLPMRPIQDRHGLSGRAGRIDAGAGRRDVKRCPSSRRLAAHHQHIGCQIERFISTAVARHLSGGGSTPVRACSGSAVQTGSSRGFSARQA